MARSTVAGFFESAGVGEAAAGEEAPRLWLVCPNPLESRIKPPRSPSVGQRSARGADARGLRALK